MAGTPAFAQSTPEGETEFDREADVLVVGLGLAGLTATLRSLDLGVENVVAIEKDSTGDWIGGNFILSGQFIHIALTSPLADAEVLREAIDLATDGTADPDTSEVLVENGARAVHWLGEMGVEFNTDSQIGVQVAPGKIGLWPYWWRKSKPGAEGDYREFGGFKAAKHLESEILDAGGTILYGRTAIKLIVNDTYDVVGVVVRDEEGAYERIGAKAVILCTGGYQANRELMTRYFGPRAENLVASGTPYNKGQGYLMALEAGAATVNHTGFYATIEPEIAAKDPDHVMSFSFPYAAAENGIIVDEYGNRFVDETGSRHTIAHYLIKQPLHNIRGLVIFDSAIYEMPAVQATIDEMIAEGIPVIQADTLEELAEASGFSKHLVDSVAEYNAAVEEERADRLSVPKVDKANAIANPPFYGLVVLPGTPYTQGSLQTTPKGEVIDLDGRVIPGLYAAGDAMTGLPMGKTENRFGGYVGGLACALIYGLVAAEAAAESL